MGLEHVGAHGTTAALAMLNEGAAGNTQKQIGDLVGNYTPKLQTNNSNKSFANALFVKESFKDIYNDKNNKYNFPLNNNFLSNIITKWKQNS